MITHKDMKSLQSLFYERTGRKLGFSNCENPEAWEVFEVEQQLFICPDCNKEFKTKGGLDLHLLFVNCEEKKEANENE